MPIPSGLSTITAAHDSPSLVPGADLLSPEDAYYRPAACSIASDAAGRSRKRREGPRSSSRRHKGHYKKLLWFRQPFPDNYTDEETFLDHLQRNPRLQPYEFWSLMADATVIVQHVASVAIFCCTFVAIAQKKTKPDDVAIWASILTALGWALCDYWMGQEEASKPSGNATDPAAMDPSDPKAPTGLGLILPNPSAQTTGHSRNLSMSSTVSHQSSTSTSEPSATPADSDAYGYHPPYSDPESALSPRNQQRLATIKSALLIYAALLGISPLLKSLTSTTSDDSIWALSTWLLCINVAFFDYRGDTGAHLPASISTNSALMASTVLASRLPSTTHVFSLTIFSIEVFGLFPIFRRQLRSKSRRGHFFLTIALVIYACGGVFVTLTGGGRGAWIAGVILGGFVTFLAMGICSWWLIGLQKYKNEIHGPWDPARPIIRRRWD